MLRYTIMCFLFASCLTLYAQDTTHIQWDPVRQMSFDSTFATVPEIVAIGDTVHLKWEISNATPVVYYRRSADGGSSWTNVINLDSTTSTAIHPQLTAANHAAYLFWFRCEPCTGATRYNTYLRNSLDAGSSWNPERFVVTEDNNGTASRESRVVFANARPLVIDSLMHSFDYGSAWRGTPKEIRPYDHFALLTSGVHLVQEMSTSEIETFYSHSSDFGVTWSQSQMLSTDDNYSSDEPFIAGDDTGNLYAAWRDGKYGSIGGFGASIIMRRSTDSGQTWLPEQLLTTVPDGLRPHISVHNNHVGITWDQDAGSDVMYRHSTDFGQTWSSPLRVGPPANYSDVAVANNAVHIVYGQRITGFVAQIMYLRGHIVTTGVLNENSLPAQYFLGQNYPNPFNGSTVIVYQVPRRTQVRIILYDILGREVRRVVSTVQQPGKYTLHIELPDLPSGMYFYRMQAGEFTETKKLLFIR